MENIEKGRITFNSNPLSVTQIGEDTHYKVLSIFSEIATDHMKLQGILKQFQPSNCEK